MGLKSKLNRACFYNNALVKMEVGIPNSDKGVEIVGLPFLGIKVIPPIFKCVD